MIENTVGYWKEKNESIMKILTMIYSNQQLARFIYYSGENNPLDSSLDDVIASQLRGDGKNKKLVFPNLKIPNTEVDGRILLSVTFERGSNGNINSLYRQDILKFAVMVHNDASEYDFGLRVFSINSYIDQMFNNIYIKDISMNKILPLAYKEFAFSDSYSGYVLTYGLGNISNSGVRNE